MFFSIFTHVDPGHGAFVIKDEGRQGLAELRLADASWTQEQEVAKSAILSLQSGPGQTDAVGNCRQGMVLAYNPLPKLFFHVQQFLRLGAGNSTNRDAGVPGNDGGNGLSRHSIRQHFVPSVLSLDCQFLVLPFHFLQFVLKSGDGHVLQLSRAIEIAISACLGQLPPGTFDLLLKLFAPLQLVTLCLPHIGQFLQSGGQYIDLLLHLGSSGDRFLIIVLICQGTKFNLLRQQISLNFPNNFGLGLLFQAKARARFVHEIDALVRLLPI
mmetsp:Transcript_2917/g.4933  ORF Transcript_2917/g.4933 Transcript_2917/m.4933 type:complete len:269 (+) Transcript_2917:839-1645(+)